MLPHLKINDRKLFYKYLDKATYYLEYGIGGSTYQASLRKNIKHIISVENDILWINKIEPLLEKTSNITIKYIEMNIKSNSWGYPNNNNLPIILSKYSSIIYTLDPSFLQNIDMILIDGRFRVACCLKCFNVINNNCNILFDDFLNRPEYHIILDYYTIIENTSDNTLVVLRKKNVSGPTLELIQSYELNSR